jgi:hypothetical protein
MRFALLMLALVFTAPAQAAEPALIVKEAASAWKTLDALAAALEARAS